MERADLAFYDDAVPHSDADEEAMMDDAPQETLKLLSDFPVPLTEPQRHAFHHHVAQQVREYEAVRSQVAIVESGYLALLRLVKRLRREVAELQAGLNESADKAGASTAGAVPTATTAGAAAPSNGPAAAPTANTSAPTAPAASATKESEAGPKRRPGGLLLRSSVFSGMQRVLQTARTEQADEKAEQLARQRERIARESRMHLVGEDLAAQEALLGPLERKYTRAVALGEAAAARARPLLTLLEDMWRLEAAYPARFSMLAQGSLEPLLHDAEHAQADSSGRAAPNGTATQAEEDGAGAEAREKIAAANGVAFMVPFRPAQYTADVEDRVRAHVEEVIDEYLAYRARMDPVLYEVEQAQQLAKAKRVDQLMDIIGVTGAEGGTEALPSAGGAYVPGGVGGRGSLTGKTAQQMMNISSDDDEDDMIDLGALVGIDAAAADRHDREQIKTALTALDDFEDT